MNIADLVEKQVINIEAGQAAGILDELKKTGKKFVDDRFPSNNNSLCGEYYPVPELAQVKWRNVAEAMPGADIF